MRFNKWADMPRDRMENIDDEWFCKELAATVTCLVLSLGYFCFWAVRATKAANFGDDWEALEFDQCGNFAKVPEDKLNEFCGDNPDCLKDIDTNWSMVFEFNAVMFGTFVLQQIG